MIVTTTISVPKMGCDGTQKTLFNLINVHDAHAHCGWSGDGFDANEQP